MAKLYTKVKKYLEANSKTWNAEKSNIILQNDTGTDYIKSWNVSELTEPTTEQLATYETAANTEEANKSYGSWEKQLEEINEQGLDSWKARIAQIKSDNPKE